MFLKLNRVYFSPEAGAGAAAGEGGTPPVGGTPPNGTGEPGAGGTPPAFDFAAYRGTIQDANLRAHTEKFTSYDDVVRDSFEARNKLSSRVVSPENYAKASPEDQGKYRKAWGVPDAPDGYKYDFGGAEVSDQDKALAAGLAEKVWHKYNIPAAAANEAVKLLVAEGARISAEAEALVKQAHDAAVAELRKEWSTEYDKNVNLASRAYEQWGGPGFKAFVESTILADGSNLGDNPIMQKVFAAIGRRTDEGDLVLQSGVSDTEKQSARQELDKLMNDNPPGTDKYKAVVGRVEELNRMIYGSKPVAGATR